MLAIVHIAVLLSIVSLGFYFLVLALRVMSADKNTYKKAQRLVGGYMNALRGDVEAPFYLDNPMISHGLAIKKNKDGTEEWARQRKLSLSALMHWRKHL